VKFERGDDASRRTLSLTLDGRFFEQSIRLLTKWRIAQPRQGAWPPTEYL
jgi:hypothetical protein